jgi:hypothetical protein
MTCKEFEHNKEYKLIQVMNNQKMQIRQFAEVLILTRMSMLKRSTARET